MCLNPLYIENLPIFFVLFKNLPMGDFITNTSNVTFTNCKGEEITTLQTTRAASDIVGAQVGKIAHVGKITEIENILNTTLTLAPVTLNFTFNTVVNGTTYRCVYWNFSDP